MSVEDIACLGCGPSARRCILIRAHHTESGETVLTLAVNLSVGELSKATLVDSI